MKLWSSALFCALFFSAPAFAKVPTEFNPCELELQTITNGVIALSADSQKSLAREVKSNGYFETVASIVKSEKDFQSQLEQLRYSEGSAYSSLVFSVRRLNAGDAKKKDYDSVNTWTQELFNVRTRLETLRSDHKKADTLTFNKFVEKYPLALPLQVSEDSGAIGLQIFEKDTFAINGTMVVRGQIVKSAAKGLAGLMFQDGVENCDLGEGTLYFVFDPSYSLEKASIFLEPKQTASCHYGPESLATLVRMALQASSAFPECRQIDSIDRSITGKLSQFPLK